MKNKIVIVMPAYNAARTIKKTYGDIPKGLNVEVIVLMMLPVIKQ